MPGVIDYQSQTAMDPTKAMPRPPRTRSTVGFNTAAVKGGRPKESGGFSGMGTSGGVQMSDPNMTEAPDYSQPARTYNSDGAGAVNLPERPWSFDINALFTNKLGRL